MQAKLMIPILLLSALAGCAGSAGTAGSDGPGSAGATAAPEGAAAPPQAAAPAAKTAPAPSSLPQSPPQTSGGSASAPPGARAGAGEGIRVGEPDPNDSRGPQRQAAGTAWHAFGNEPFWSVQARGGTLVFTTPDDQAGVTLSGRRVPSLVGTVILGSGPKGEFHFGVTPGDCSDGMSDRTHAFHSTFSYGGTTYNGCAEPADAR